MWCSWVVQLVSHMAVLVQVWLWLGIRPPVQVPREGPIGCCCVVRLLTMMCVASCVLGMQGTLEEEAAAEDTGLLGRFVGGLIAPAQPS